MLILTRKIGETVMIGEDVMFTIVRVKGRQVGIGISAPKPVTILREELYERYKREGPPEAQRPIPKNGV